MERFLRAIKELKRELLILCIVREWMDNGEFDAANRIVVIGSTLDAIVVNIVMRQKKKQVYQCTRLQQNNGKKDRTKWIVFENGVWNDQMGNGYDVLFVPCNILSK